MAAPSDTLEANAVRETEAETPPRAIRVSGAALAAASLFSAREDTRYYLGGVFIEPHADGGVTVVATDGHTLIAIRDLAGHANAPANCRLPPAAIRAAAMTKWPLVEGSPRRLPAVATAYFFGSSLHIIAEDPAALPTLPVDEDDIRAPHAHTMFFGYAPAIDGDFPIWRRVVPPAGATWPALPPFNPDFLARFAKADRLLAPLNCGPFHLMATGETAPIVVSGESDTWFGLIMPRWSGGRAGLPAWHRPAAPEAESAA